MKFLTHNRILKNTIFGLLVAFVLLAPLSLGVGVEGGERSGDAPTVAALTLSTNVAFAADPADGSVPGAVVPISKLHWDQRLGVMFMKIGAWLAGGGGVLLHLSMTELVIGMGDLIVHKGYGEAINANWAVIRDICNLVFIFGFIYIGIRTIIDYDSPTTKRFLSQIIIGAILINFSLFITKAVIDFSNFTAMQVYTAMAPERGADGKFDANYGISAQYANLMGLSGMYGSKGWQDGAAATGPAYSSFTFYLIAMVVLMIAAFVFAAGAILLVVRFAALVLIMIFSPLLFAATVFPKTAKYASDLWSKLFSYAFFAPVYFFLLLLSATVLSKSSNALGTANQDLGVGIMTPGAQSLTVLLQFFLVIFFLILSLKIAQSMGIQGGQMAVKVATDVKNRGQRAITNTAQSIGRGSANVALYPGRALTRAGVGYASKKGLEKFDKWQAKPENKDSVINKLNLDRSIRGTLESGKKVKAGLKYSYQENKDYETDRNKRTANNWAEDQRELNITNGSNAMAVAAAAATQPPTLPDPDVMKDMVKAIKGLTASEMKDMDINILTKEEVAVHLSTKQIDELEKTGKYSERQIKDIKDARENGVKNIASGTAGTIMVGGQSQRELLAQRGADELAKMPIGVFTSNEMAPYLTPDIIETKMKSGISITERNQIQASINAELAGKGPNDSYVQQWRKWTERSTHGARLGLNIPTQQAAPGTTTSPGGIILPVSGGGGPRPRTP